MFNLKSLDITALVLLGILIICFMTNNLSLINNDGVVTNNIPVPTTNNLPKQSNNNNNRQVNYAPKTSNSVMGYNGDTEGTPINIRQSRGLDGYAEQNRIKFSEVLNSTDLKPSNSNNDFWDQPYDLNKLNDINLVNGTRIAQPTNPLRNASLDLRPEPENPKVSVSPWLISTIEPNNFKNKLCG